MPEIRERDSKAPRFLKFEAHLEVTTGKYTNSVEEYSDFLQWAHKKGVGYYDLIHYNDAGIITLQSNNDIGPQLEDCYLIESFLDLSDKDLSSYIVEKPL